MNSGAVEEILVTILIVGWIAVLVFFIGWLFRNQLKNIFKNKPKPDKEILQSKAVLLTIEVPKENEKTPLAAETLFSSLHGIGNNRLSFEIEAKEKSIRFYVWVPEDLRGYVESQLYAQYPNINIYETKDYSSANKIADDAFMVSTELDFKKEDFYPIKTFINFTVDPLAAITAILSKLDSSENVWIQLIITPEDDSWRDRALNFITAIREGRSPGLSKSIGKQLLGLAKEVVTTAMGNAESEEKSPKKEITLPPDSIF